MVWESVEYAREVPSGRTLDRPQSILGTIWELTVLLQQPELTVPPTHRVPTTSPFTLLYIQAPHPVGDVCFKSVFFFLFLPCLFSSSFSTFLPLPLLFLLFLLPFFLPYVLLFPSQSVAQAGLEIPILLP